MNWLNELSRGRDDTQQCRTAGELTAAGGIKYVLVLLDRRRVGREWGGALSLRDMLLMLNGSEVAIELSSPFAAPVAADRTPEE